MFVGSYSPEYQPADPAATPTPRQPPRNALLDSISFSRCAPQAREVAGPSDAAVLPRQWSTTPGTLGRQSISRLAGRAADLVSREASTRGDQAREARGRLPCRRSGPSALPPGVSSDGSCARTSGALDS